MPEDFLCHSLPGSRRRSRGERGVGRDGSAELPFRDRSRCRLFLLHVPRSALCARLSRNTVGLLWFSWFWVTFLFLCLFTFCILFSFLVFYTEGFTWIIIVTFAIVTFVVCIEFFYEGWEDWKPDVESCFTVNILQAKKKHQKNIDEHKTGLHLLIADAGLLLLSPINPRPWCGAFLISDFDHPFL